MMMILLSSSDTIKQSDACVCDKILSENDCKSKTGCTWTATPPADGTTTTTTGKCETTTTTTEPVPQTYCETISEPEKNCAKTTGCAYVDSKCTHFTGCSAYVKTTNLDCQAISILCITDGTQCVDAKLCSEYTTQTDCQNNPSTSGILKCKYDNGTCRDYMCSEAPTDLSTDEACDGWKKDCKTTKKGCIETVPACSGYSGNDVDCAGLEGTDGKCEGEPSGT